MFSWIKNNPLYAGIILAVLLAIVTGVLLKWERDDIREEENLVNQGVIYERSQSQGKVLDNVEKARDAVDNPTDAERSSVCSRYDRNCPAANSQ